MPVIDIRGARLNYLEAGKGKPIICFHSTPASAEFYRPQLEHFSKDYRVIAVDLRGHGESEKPCGGTVDLSARAIGPTLSEVLRQNVIIDNRGGAAGMTGSAFVAKAPADGYTLLLESKDANIQTQVKP